VTGYTWDAEDRLVRIDFPGGTFAAYRYDGLGRRIEKDVDGTVTRYVYDGADILLEYDGADVLQARYTHGPGIDDPAIAERDLDASGSFEAAERVFFHTDGLGSATELSDATGAVAGARAYDAYGRIVQETGAAIAQPYAFTGREFDAESALYFYRARYYDPASGRFLSEDPLGFGAGDANLYSYAFDSPVNLRDPDGRILPGIIAAGCFVGAIGGVVGGFEGTVLGSAIRVTADAIRGAKDRGEVGQASNDATACQDSKSAPLPGSSGPDTPDFATPDVGDLLTDALFNAGLGCASGIIAVIRANPATVFAGTILGGTAGLTGGFIGGVFDPVKGLFF